MGRGLSNSCKKQWPLTVHRLPQRPRNGAQRTRGRKTGVFAGLWAINREPEAYPRLHC